MNTKLCFAMLSLLVWVLTFSVIVASALHAECFFPHDTYHQKLLGVAFVNLICVVYFISIKVNQQTEIE